MIHLFYYVRPLVLCLYFLYTIISRRPFLFLFPAIYMFALERVSERVQPVLISTHDTDFLKRGGLTFFCIYITFLFLLLLPRAPYLSYLLVLE